jgi:hypothetical protein
MTFHRRSLRRNVHLYRTPTLKRLRIISLSTNPISENLPRRAVDTGHQKDNASRNSNRFLVGFCRACASDSTTRPTKTRAQGYPARPAAIACTLTSVYRSWLAPSALPNRTTKLGRVRIQADDKAIERAPTALDSSPRRQSRGRRTASGRSLMPR